ncbi:hypothetical protein BH09BAC6_BH09BAC6_21310 [soil metagenome]|jgi:hypothetical protein
MKLLSLLLLLTVTQHAVAQIKTTPLEKNAVPKTVKYTGHIINAVKYNDIDGNHLVITTETGITPSKSKDVEGGRNASLYAYHYYIDSNNQYKLTWQTYDFALKDCPLDIVANYIPGSFAITDLNNDGRAEVWLMYQTGCRGDVSPSEMKIIMHEGVKKYALRGSSKVEVMDKQFAGGEYAFDEAFKSGPAVFRQHALGLWKKNILESGQ